MSKFKIFQKWISTFYNRRRSALIATSYKSNRQIQYFTLLPLLSRKPEETEWFELRGADLKAVQKVCIYVSFVKDGKISRRAEFAMRSLKYSGFFVFFIAIRQNLSDPFIVPDQDIADIVCSRANSGWDFGAWAAAFKKYPELWHVDSLLLMNDSVIGPLRSMDVFFEKIEKSQAAIFGFTESSVIRPHLQSYWIYYKASALRHPMIKNYWDRIVDMKEKWDVILFYETTLLEACKVAGIRYHAFFKHADHHFRPRNPTHKLPFQLLENGFPFVKVDLVRNDPFHKKRDRISKKLKSVGVDPGLFLELCSDI